ncbi:dATP/dGTP pyrophosphohydrolase domain-containing protein, partial [Cronobacter sakazakii]|uniref:dATP/dGTP pyrophosphohydrolase domain-containing protein n=1 Tax=Cronobacter sakazakii TaxID=28141 RepID=UPI001F262EFB
MRQQDYDPVEGEGQNHRLGRGIVAMEWLLALRKERERAGPWFYGPYTPVMVGAGVWVSIADELPPHLAGHKVWVTTSPTAPPAPVVPERDQVRANHAEWSKATFGSVGPIGPLKHLAKETLEAAAAPGHLYTWADRNSLLGDAQRVAWIRH